jgi:hypothetical protein
MTVPDAVRALPKTFRDVPFSVREFPKTSRDVPFSARYVPNAGRAVPFFSRYVPNAARYVPFFVRDVPTGIRESGAGALGRWGAGALGRWMVVPHFLRTQIPRRGCAVKCYFWKQRSEVRDQRSEGSRRNRRIAIANPASPRGYAGASIECRRENVHKIMSTKS